MTQLTNFAWFLARVVVLFLAALWLIQYWVMIHTVINPLAGYVHVLHPWLWLS